MRRIVSTILILAFATFVSPMPVAFAQGQQGGGNVVGTATDAANNPLANYTVRLRNVGTAQKEIISETTSATNGGYSFANVPAGQYQIEIVAADGTIVGTSSTVAVTAGATATINVAASALAAAAGGVSTTFIAALVAAGVGTAVTVAVVTQDDDDSPSR